MNRKKVKLIFDWCFENFGKSRYNKTFPKLSVRSYKGLNQGEYYNNVITIFPRMHRTYLDLCNTVIHEYKHYLLPNDSYSTMFRKLEAKGLDRYEIFNNHPHEKKCVKFANFWQHVCFNELEDQLKRK